jgi:hypothetical protein
VRSRRSTWAKDGMKLHVASFRLAPSISPWDDSLFSHTYCPIQEIEFTVFQASLSMIENKQNISEFRIIQFADYLEKINCPANQSASLNFGQNP